ncbi:Innexin [Aphelenchoides fujianensis]|nr:Innexin [Aphelenchoides fujianensis]
MVFSEVVGTLSFLQPQSDDDFADRANYYITSTALLVTAVLVSLKLFGGRPLECFMPAEFRSSWEDYTEMYCFASSTYWTRMDEEFPQVEQRQQQLVSYYQWTPFYLVITAFSFYAPCMIWRILYTKSGIQLKELMLFANDKTNIQPTKREANIRGNGHSLIFMYLMNVVFQMYLMNWFLQTTNYTFYGWGVLLDLVNGRPWTESGNFPRISYCDMDIRVLGNIQRHTIQCVLVINIFIEKIFVCCGFGLLYTILFIVTLSSLVNWCLSSLPFEARKRFIARRLELADVDFRQAKVERELNRFVSEYIKMDGVFVLKMLTIHSGVLICTGIVDNMWEEFNRSEEDGKISPGVVDFQPGGPAGGQLMRRKQSVLQPLVARDDVRPIFPAASPVTPATPFFGGQPSESILRMPHQSASFGPSSTREPK